MHVKKGDTVVIISGDEKGKKGKVLKAFPKAGKVLVEGVNMATKHQKPKPGVQQTGIIHEEAPVSSSKVMIFCPNCNEGVRYRTDTLQNGEKVRVCIKCNESLDK